MCVLNFVIATLCLCASWPVWFYPKSNWGPSRPAEITSRCSAAQYQRVIGRERPRLQPRRSPSSVWLLVHWRSGWSFTPRPEGAHILSPLWPHKESQVLRRAWLAALICYLWLISEALSHRWWSLAVNLTWPTSDCVCVCVCERARERQTDWQIYGEICKKKKCAEATKEDSQSRHVLSRFVICFGQSVLCYCCILPICIGPDLLCQFPTWLTRACVHEGFISCHSLAAPQFVAALSGSGECARLSFHRSRCLDSAGLNSVH